MRQEQLCAIVENILKNNYIYTCTLNSIINILSANGLEYIATSEMPALWGRA